MNNKSAAKIKKGSRVVFRLENLAVFEDAKVRQSMKRELYAEGFRNKGRYEVLQVLRDADSKERNVNYVFQLEVAGKPRFVGSYLFDAS